MCGESGVGGACRNSDPCAPTLHLRAARDEAWLALTKTGASDATVGVVASRNGWWPEKIVGDERI